MKKALLVLVVLLAAFTMYACSNNNNENAGNNTPGNEGNSGSGSGEKASLTIGLPGAYGVTSEEIIEGFIAAHPEIDVEIQEAPWGDFVTQITTRVAGGTAPDIWFEENAKILGYGARGVAEDLTTYFEDLNSDDYIDLLYSSQSPDGAIYGIPHGINPIALAYNKSVFDDAGVDYPTDDWTYEDLIDAAIEITANTPDDVYGFGLGSNITQGYFPWIKANGGMLLDETLTEARFTDPKTVEAIEIWASMINELGVSPDQDTVQALGPNQMQEGHQAMTFFQYSSQVNTNANYPDLEWDTVKIPKGFNGNPRVVPVIVNSWLINSQAEQASKDAAWTFMKYYLGEEAQMILAESGASLPVSVAGLDAVAGMTDTNPSNKAAFTDGIAESGMTMDESPAWQEWRTAAEPIFLDIRDGHLSAEEGLEEINKVVQRVLDDQ